MGNVEIALTGLFVLLIVGCAAAFWIGRVIALSESDERRDERRPQRAPSTHAAQRRKSIFEARQAD